MIPVGFPEGDGWFMVPASFAEANEVLDKPEGLTYDQCEVLNICRAHLIGTNQMVLVSCWKLTPQEMAEVQRTGRVWLMVHGAQHPLVNLFGVKPLRVEPPALEDKRDIPT